MAARTHVLIFGRVQGVFFRAWVKEKAESLGLTGWVRNTSQGEVEAVFEGEKGKVEEMIKKCWEGPRLAQAEKVEVDWQEATEEFKGFEIK